jgi:hypothetical protein
MTGLPKSNLFFDVSTIGGGEDFVQRIEAEIGRSDAAIVFIGDKWLEPAPGSGQGRIWDANDFVRAELRAASARPMLVLPVLVGGARMPKPEQLPEDVRAIALKNALPLRHESFDGDTERIVGAVLGLSAKERAWEDKGSLARKLVYGVGGAVAGALIILAIALLHHAALARPLSASIGGPLTTLLLVGVAICGLWLGLRYETHRRKFR